MSDDKIKVRLQLRGQWTYCQDVEMTQAEYDKYDRALDGERKERRRAESDLAGLWMDMRDIDIDDSDIELDDFRIVEPQA